MQSNFIDMEWNPAFLFAALGLAQLKLEERSWYDTSLWVIGQHLSLLLKRYWDLIFSLKRGTFNCKAIFIYRFDNKPRHIVVEKQGWSKTINISQNNQDCYCPSFFPSGQACLIAMNSKLPTIFYRIKLYSLLTLIWPKQTVVICNSKPLKSIYTT